VADSGSTRVPPAGEGVSFVAGPDDQPVRLDRFLADRLEGVSRSRIQALIKAGQVSGAGRTLVDAGDKVKPGETIEILVPPPEAAAPLAEDIPLVVVFEDAHLIVIDKPAGLVVHPAAGHATGTLVNALLAHCGESLSGVGGVRRPGIVHRLDKDTSGLLVAAKSDAAHQGLSAQFAAHGVDGLLTRRYLALAWGGPPHSSGRIDAALARSSSNRTKIAVVPGGTGRHAVTHYEVQQRFLDATGKPLASLLACVLETGRTHQIRVHLAHIGHPLLGDPTYGAHFAASARRLSEEARGSLEALGRQALHAAHLGFVHPVTRKKLAFDSPLPADLARLSNLLAAGTPRPTDKSRLRRS
jgi:23S rRNA pseudouridine1911/1915/1917 synthase